VTISQPCVDRCSYQIVSSGRFAYQISMYWLNQMYIQKTVKPKRYFPRSWKCSIVASPRSIPPR
jgi:hypothetical protein